MWGVVLGRSQVAVVFPFPPAIDGGAEIETIKEDGGEVKASLAVEVDGHEVDDEPITPYFDDFLGEYPSAYDIERGGEGIQCRHGGICQIFQQKEDGKPDGSGDQRHDAELRPPKVTIDDLLCTGLLGIVVG